jgi:hypothetical protein
MQWQKQKHGTDLGNDDDHGDNNREHLGHADSEENADTKIETANERENGISRARITQKKLVKQHLNTMKTHLKLQECNWMEPQE